MWHILNHFPIPVFHITYLIFVSNIFLIPFFKYFTSASFFFFFQCEKSNLDLFFLPFSYIKVSHSFIMPFMIFHFNYFKLNYFKSDFTMFSYTVLEAVLISFVWLTDCSSCLLAFMHVLVYFKWEQRWCTACESYMSEIVKVLWFYTSTDTEDFSGSRLLLYNFIAYEFRVMQLFWILFCNIFGLCRHTFFIFVLYMFLSSTQNLL